MNFKTLAIAALAALIGVAHAQEQVLDELNPYDSNIEETLRLMDEQYELETGLSSHLRLDANDKSDCYRASCQVFIDVVKSAAPQHADVYVGGVKKYTWNVSTGIEPGHRTPNFDTHPNGRIYDSYMSRTYPGGDYNGLGNMPYAVFIKGGFAIHGTGRSNWPKLGTRASHGCIRLHPDNAKIFNRLVRGAGIAQTWITVR